MALGFHVCSGSGQREGRENAGARLGWHTSGVMKLEKTVLLMALVIGRTKKGESVLILVNSSASSTGVMAEPVYRRACTVSDWGCSPDGHGKS